MFNVGKKMPMGYSELMWYSDLNGVLRIQSVYSNVKLN